LVNSEVRAVIKVDLGRGLAASFGCSLTKVDCGRGVVLGATDGGGSDGAAVEPSSSLPTFSMDSAVTALITFAFDAAGGLVAVGGGGRFACFGAGAAAAGDGPSVGSEPAMAAGGFPLVLPARVGFCLGVLIRTRSLVAHASVCAVDAFRRVTPSMVPTVRACGRSKYVLLDRMRAGFNPTRRAIQYQHQPSSTNQRSHTPMHTHKNTHKTRVTVLHQSVAHQPQSQ
jgi:hypothetical protein